MLQFDLHFTKQSENELIPTLKRGDLWVYISCVTHLTLL